MYYVILYSAVFLAISQKYYSRIIISDPINFEYDEQSLQSMPYYVYKSDVSRIRKALRSRSEARARALIDSESTISPPHSNSKYPNYDPTVNQNTIKHQQSQSYVDNVFSGPSIFENNPLERAFGDRIHEISKNSYGLKYDAADKPFDESGKSAHSDDAYLRDLDNWKLAIGMGDSGSQFQRQIRSNNSVTFYSEFMQTDLSNTTTTASEMSANDLFPEWLELDLTNMTLIQKEAYRSRGFTDYTVLYEDIFKEKSILDTESLYEDPNIKSAPVQAQNETRFLMFNQTIIVRWQVMIDQDNNMISGTLFEVTDQREAYMTEDDRIFRMESDQSKNITAVSEENADQLEDLAEAVQEWITIDLETDSGDIGEETHLMPGNSTKEYLPRGLLVDITYDNATVPQLWKGLETKAPLNVTQVPMLFNSDSVFNDDNRLTEGQGTKPNNKHDDKDV